MVTNSKNDEVSESKQPMNNSEEEIQKPGTAAEDVVARDTYLKVLEEKKRLADLANQLQTAEKDRQAKELSDRGEYKKLLEQREQELKDLRDQLTENSRKEADRMRLASILEAVPGDIDSKYYGLIPYQDVVINPETGEVDKMSVTKAVEALQRTYPEILQQSNNPKLPSQAPTGGTPGKISRSEWLKLSPAEMKKWNYNQIIN